MINVHVAKTKLSRFLEQVEKGEEIVIARAGTPVALLSSIKAHSGTRVFGALKGKIHIADDFDSPVDSLTWAK